MSVEHSVRAGQSRHGSGKFPVLTVFIRKVGSMEYPADFLICGTVIAPFKPGFPPIHVQPQVDRHILHRGSGIHVFRLHSVFQTYHRQGTLSQGLAVILSQIDIIHIVIIEDQTCAVLIDLRLKLHFRCDAHMK